MAKQKPDQGKLIALEGLHDLELRRAGKQLLRQLSNKNTAGGVSQWDASGLFFQLGRSQCPDVPSPKTLLMLYAADLAFRLRWEIGPLLAEGKDVVAAPYVETAVAFGRAAGVELEWMEQLFEFAPAADLSFRIKSPAARAKGFPSRCFQILAGASSHWKAKASPKPLTDHLIKLKAMPAASARRRPTPTAR
jgi:hypothetical protein